MTPRTVVIPGNGTSSLTFEIPPGVDFNVESVFAAVDATAAGDTTGELQIADQSGVVIAAKRQGLPIPGGDTGSDTWALRLDDEEPPLGNFISLLDSADVSIDVLNQTGPHAQLLVETVTASIARDGAAAAQNVTSGALTVTTTAVQHNVASWSHDMTADVVSTPSRLVVQYAGVYLVVAVARWLSTSAADFGVSTGIAPAATGLINPHIISRRVTGNVMNHTASTVLRLNVNDVICQTAGQNSGGNIAAPVSNLFAWRLGPLQ